MKKSMPMVAASIVISALVLGACSSNEAANEAEPTAAATAATPADSGTPAPEPSAAPSEEPANTDGSEPQASERPATQAFDELEGGVPGQTGTLTQGDGYSLYIFDGFTLDAAAGRLSLAEDTAYYAEIEPLPSDYDLAVLEQQGKEELSAISDPKNYSGELIEHPLSYAELYLQASGEEGLEDYIIWKNQNGEAYLFHIHNPKGELSEQFAGWLMVSLSTIEAE